MASILFNTSVLVIKLLGRSDSRQGMRMEKYHIELTDEEEALVDAVDLRVSHPDRDEAYAAYEVNKQPILALLESLRERGAIPEEGLNYWNRPDYNTDRRLKVSNKGMFERNGCTGQEIYTHPHFIPYLRYFGGCEARLAGGEGSAPERAQAHDGVGPGQREGSTVALFR